jgi:hypothetical protein
LLEEVRILRSVEKRVRLNTITPKEVASRVYEYEIKI